MSRWSDVEGVAVDSEGYDCHFPRPFESVNEARQWARRVSTDRAFWVQLSESETFPDQIVSVVLRRDGKTLHVYDVRFEKGGACE